MHLIIKILSKFDEKTDKNQTTSVHTLKIITRYATYSIILVMFLEIFGIDINSILLSVGVVSIAVTLIAKDTLTNVISGISNMIEKKFVTGDMIEIDGNVGRVTKIGLKTVEMYNKNTYYVVPNVLFNQKVLKNFTRDGYYPLRFHINISNSYNLEEKLNQIRDVIENSNLILDKPHFTVRPTEITPYGVKVLVKVFIKDASDDVRVIDELITQIKRDVELKDSC